jgi:transposase-like protein
MDKDQLENLYVTQKLSANSIAKKLNTTTITVLKLLKSYGFKIRSSGESKTLSSKVNPNFPDMLKDQNWLKQKYITEGMSVRAIAEQFNLNRRTIQKAIKFYNLDLRNLTDARQNRILRGSEFYFKGSDVNDLEKIADLYVNQKKNVSALCEQFNVSTSAIRHRLQAADVVMRKPWESRIGQKHSNKSISKMSDTATKQMFQNLRGKGNSFHVEYVTPDNEVIMLRSRYEYHYAEFLKNSDIKYKYELKSFKLSNGKSIIPDFYLEDTCEFIEIKGYLTDEQAAKYELFKQEYPDVKWSILTKDDLMSLGINVKAAIINGKVLKTPKSLKERAQDKSIVEKPIQLANIVVYFVVGASGAGKSWVCEQLTDMANYVNYDKGDRMAHSSSILDAWIKNNRPCLFDPTTNVITYFNSFSTLFTVKLIVIDELYDVVSNRLLGRGGQVTNSLKKRVKRMNSLSKKAEFSGTSDEVLQYLKSKLANTTTSV